MFSSPILRKLKRAIRGKRGGKPAKLSGARLASLDLVIDSIDIHEGGLRLSVRPPMPAVNILLQLSTKGGKVICTHAVDAQLVRIAPGVPVEMQMPLDARSLQPGTAHYLIDVSQGAFHAHRSLALLAGEESIDFGYSKVEAFLQTRALVDVPVERVVPKGRDELVSMSHLEDEDFVQYCYFWLLGRDADPVGLQHYLKAMNEGLSRLDLIAGMYRSEESVTFRRLSPVSLSGQAAFPFSAAHDRMRLAMGAVTRNPLGEMY